MIMKRLIYFTISLLLVMGCGSALHTTGDSIIPGAPGVNVPELNGKVIVDKSKVLRGSSKTTVVLGIFRSGDNKFLDAPMPGPAGNRTKRAAVYKALEGTNYDIIVNPKYIIEIKKNLFMKTTSCQVSGYGGRIEIQ